MRERRKPDRMCCTSDRAVACGANRVGAVAPSRASTVPTPDRGVPLEHVNTPHQHKESTMTSPDLDHDIDIIAALLRVAVQLPKSANRELLPDIRFRVRALARTLRRHRRQR
jgi:hypothetical protein